MTRPHWRLPEPRAIQVLGHRIHYWDAGQGDPIVLVHGFSGSAVFEWGPVFEALALRHRVVALQVIGFAPSEQPEIAYTTEALVSHLGGFLRALGLENVTLLGESFGGWHVAAYAAKATALGLPQRDDEAADRARQRPPTARSIPRGARGDRRTDPAGLG
jgi:pimeloyl-ACP methyl ester carboxylesterase